MTKWYVHYLYFIYSHFKQIYTVILTNNVEYERIKCQKLTHSKNRITLRANLKLHILVLDLVRVYCIIIKNA